MEDQEEIEVALNGLGLSYISLMHATEIEYIYKCYSEQLDKNFAVKVTSLDSMVPNTMSGEEFRSRLLQSLDRLNKFSYINGSIGIVDKHVTDHYLIIIMELYHCHLSDIIDHYPNGVPEIVMQILIRQILICLHSFHQKQIIHCNLTPETIVLLDDYKTIKLLNVEYAINVTNNQSSLIISPIHTDYYTDPYIRKHNFQYSKFSDTWSVGVILLHMLFGKIPFRNNNELTKINDSKIVELLSNKSNISSDFLDFILKCVQYDPQERCNVYDLLSHEYMQSIESIYNQFRITPSLSLPLDDVEYSTCELKQIYNDIIISNTNNLTNSVITDISTVNDEYDKSDYMNSNNNSTFNTPMKNSDSVDYNSNIQSPIRDDTPIDIKLDKLLKDEINHDFCNDITIVNKIKECIKNLDSTLDFSHIFIGNKSGDYFNSFGSCLLLLDHIEKLIFKNCSLSGIGIKVIFSYIKRMGRLKSLDLSNNSIDRDGIEYIISNMTSRIKELDIRANSHDLSILAIGDIQRRFPQVDLKS